MTGIGYENPSSGETFLSWQPKLARIQSPARWRQLDGGYITWVDMFSNIATYVLPCSPSPLPFHTIQTHQTNSLDRFFKQPYFDIGVVKTADANKEPFALMEVITLGITPLGTNFTGPVLVLTGEYDFIFCTGYCGGILIPSAEKTFPDSKGLEVYMQPDSGHGINLSVSWDVTGFEICANSR